MVDFSRRFFDTGSNVALKIFSYNIHKGFNFTQRFVLAGIREIIRAENADVVFLQEVLGDHRRHGRTLQSWKGSQFEFLADEIWPHFAYGKNAVYTQGHHGNAILSRLPILSSENIDISNHRLERRGILHACIEYEGQPLHLLNVHLDLTDRGRARQFQRIRERIQQHIPQNEALILAGDFNDWREKATRFFADEADLQEVFWESFGAHAKSFPSFRPTFCLDRIYVRGLEIVGATAHSGAPWSKLSDHTALSAQVRRP